MAGIIGSMPEGGLQLIAFTTAVELSLLFARLPCVLASWLRSRFCWVSSDSHRVGATLSNCSSSRLRRDADLFDTVRNALSPVRAARRDAPKISLANAARSGAVSASTSSGGGGDVPRPSAVALAPGSSPAGAEGARAGPDKKQNTNPAKPPRRTLLR
jgi:hypothetical protein